MASRPEVSYIEVNGDPLRYFKLKAPVSSVSHGTSEKYIILDISGSMTSPSQKSLVRYIRNLRGKSDVVKVFVFGRRLHDVVRTGYPMTPWFRWLHVHAAHWIDIDELLTNYERLVKTGLYGVRADMWCWGTYTDMIRIAVNSLPAEVSIDMIFFGDGAFSDRNFLNIVRHGRDAGKFRHVKSFTFLAAHNTSRPVELDLTQKLQSILVSSTSSIKWSSTKLGLGECDMLNALAKISSSAVIASPGWDFFDSGTGPMLLHNKLTPASIATIFKTHRSCIPEACSYLVSVMKTSPIVFTQEDIVSSKIYQALKILKNFKNDTYNIKMYLLSPISRAVQIKDHMLATRKQAMKILCKKDESANHLFMEKMSVNFTGRSLMIVGGDGCPVISAEDFNEILRDMSFNSLIHLLDRLFCEASSVTITTKTGTGLAICKDDVEDRVYIQSMRMMPSLFGLDGELASGNVLLIFAMYILTNDYIDHPYLNRLAHTFIFSDTGMARLSALVYKEDTSGGSAVRELQDNVYSAAFSRIFYQFYLLQMSELRESNIDFTLIKNIYTSFCEIVNSREYSYSIPVSRDTYDFREGDWCLIDPISWSESGKECPYPEMVNLVYITPANTKDRNYKPGHYRVRFLEGDSADYTYAKAKYMSVFVNARDVTSPMKKAVRKFQRDMWLKWLHYPDRVTIYDGKKLDSITGKVVTYKENLAELNEIITSHDSGCRWSVVNSTGSYMTESITKSIPVPKKIIWKYLGLEGSPITPRGRVTRDMIHWFWSRDTIDIDSLPDFTLDDPFGVFTYTLTKEDIGNIIDGFKKKLNDSMWRECDCGCEMVLRPGTAYQYLPCNHVYVPLCLENYQKTLIQDAKDIRFDISACPDGCVGCIAPILRLSDRTVVITAHVSDAIVNATGRNVVGRCDGCCGLFVRGPRDCATAHELPTLCTECLPKRFWQCPGYRDDGERCSVMTEHGGGCRMMQCCPCRNGWDDPCKDDCEHILLYNDNPIARGCGHRYKMDDGLEQEDGTAQSDGSHFY